MGTVANRESTGIQRAQAGIFALVLAGVAACGDNLPTRQPSVAMPVAGLPVLAELRGRVDLETGTMTFEPATPGGDVAGLSAAIYGDQNVNIRLYNSAVVIDSSGSPKKWTTTVGLKNLRSHFIGDEETGLVPLDTMGIYIFFTQDPVPLAPCPGCFARIANHDGTGTFDLPNRKYFHWPERVNPAGALSGDTSLARKTWVFETSPQARTFTFSVLVAAAWPPPFETRWKIEYTADFEPNTLAKPLWKVLQSGSGGTWSASGGQLNIKGRPGGRVQFYRRDPIAPSQDAYIHAKLRLKGGSDLPEVGVHLDDRLKLLSVGVSKRFIGFIDSNGAFIPGTTVALGNGDLEVQLRKYGADSAVFYFGNGGAALQRGGALPYSTFSADPYAVQLVSALFGVLPTSGGNNSDWDYVIYEIGAVQP